jgi:GH25 family lysozyme M1 (1,4-beta-N-acetylmuramidase)
MSSSIYGIDISNNEGSVDFTKVAADSVVIVYLKATEGTSGDNSVDAYMDEFYSQASPLGFKLGAYQFLIGTSSATTQAQNFWDHVKDKNWDCIPFLDIETNFDGLSDAVVEFINEWETLTDMPLGIYTYSSFMPYLEDIKDTIKDMPLWEANYDNEPWSLPDNDIFNNRVGHQYSETGSVNGVSTNCDLDSFTEGVFLSSIEVTNGTWKDDNKGWWFEYTNPIADKFPANAWAYLPKSNNDSTPAWFYFNPSGYMVTGWINTGNCYYLDSKNGDMKTGWFKDSTGKWFYADENGVMQTGWKQIESKWYYLQETKDDTHVKGEMRTGWINITGNNYLLDSSGVMYSNCTAYGYSFDSNGVATKLS